MVGPIQHQPLPPPDFSSFEQSLFSQQSQDTSSSFSFPLTITIGNTGSIVIDGPTITIGQFADAVGLSLNNSRYQLRQNDFMAYHAGGRAGLSEGALHVLFEASQTALTDIYNAETAIIATANGQIAAENALINNYNSALNSGGGVAADIAATNAMNAAITDYNNGAITAAQFNVAVTAYNAYVAARNAALSPSLTAYNGSVPTYNAQAAVNNAATDALNLQLQQLGLPPFPTQPPTLSPLTPYPTQAMAPLSTPVPLIPTPTGAISTIDPLPALPPLEEFLATNTETVVTLALIALSLNDRRNDLYDAFREFNVFYIKGRSTTDVNAFFSSIPQTFFTSSSGSALGSTGVATSAISTGFHTPGLSGSISQGIFLSDLALFDLEMTDPMLNHFAIYGLRTASSSGLTSALPGIRLIGASAATSAQAVTAFGVAIGISHGQIVAETVNSNQLRAVIQQIVLDELGVNADAETIERTTSFLTSALSLFLLETALLVAATSSRIPGLPAQVFRNVEGISPEALQQPVTQTLDQAANDPLKAVFLKSTLASQLVRDLNMEQEAADTLINDAVNATLAQGDFETSSEYRRRLIQQLVARGLTNAQAAVVAEGAVNILTAETEARQIVNSDLLDQQKNADKVSAELINNGYSVDEARRIAEAAVQQVLQQGVFFNATEFNLALAIALENEGVERSRATVVSENAVAALNVLPAETPPLSTPFSPITLTPTSLGAAIYANVYGTLSPLIGADRAREAAELAVETYVGVPTSDVTQQPGEVRPPGILVLLQEHTDELRRLGGDDALDRILGNFRNFQAPNIDLFDFSNKILNPAYAFLHVAASGLMYSGAFEPSKDKKDLDILV